MRLGLYPADLAAGSLAREAYGEATIQERHRHRYEVNNAYREQLAEAGLVFSGTNPDLDLVEFVELPRDVHPYYVATQAHPELRSRPTRPHPLFKGLIGAALDRQRELRFPIDETGLRREPERRVTSSDHAGRPAGGLAGRREHATCTAATGSSRCARDRIRHPDQPRRRDRSSGSSSSIPAPSWCWPSTTEDRARLPVAVPPRRASSGSSSSRPA